MATSAAGPSFLDVRTPVKMPDALRGEKYAFVALPLAEFLPGGDVTDENIGVGRLCPIDPSLPADAFVQGVVILTQRPEALAAWLAGTEVAALSCDLRKRNLINEHIITGKFTLTRCNTQPGGRVALRIEVNQHGLPSGCRHRSCNVDSAGGLTHPALLVGDRDGQHTGSSLLPLWYRRIQPQALTIMPDSLSVRDCFT